MNASLDEHVRVGLVHFMAFPQCMQGEGPILETVTQIAEDPFFSVLEITSIKDADVRADVADILDLAHMSVAFAAQPIILSGNLNLNSADTEERDEAVRILCDTMDEAVELGAEGFAILSGRDPGEERREDALGWLVDSLQELCDCALTKGLDVTLETFDRTIDKKALIGPSDDAGRVAELVNRNNFGLLLDLSHLPIQFESPYTALHTVQDFLTHVHIGNCVLEDPDHPAYGDMHPAFGIEGGENDVDEVVEFLDVLMDIGYLGPLAEERPIISFEVRPMEGQSASLVLANAKRTLTAAWAQLGYVNPTL